MIRPDIYNTTKEGSFEVPMGFLTQAVQRFNLRPSEIAVYVALCGLCDAKGRAKATMREIGALTGLSQPTICKAIQRLDYTGLLLIIQKSKLYVGGDNPRVVSIPRIYIVIAKAGAGWHMDDPDAEVLWAGIEPEDRVIAVDNWPMRGNHRE